jgi:signal transduction histidine kinase
MRSSRSGADADAPLPFLDAVISRLLESWPEGGFLDRETAQAELDALAAWLRGREPGAALLPEQGDRLLLRRLAQVFQHGLLAYWQEHGREGDAEAFMQALSALHGLPRADLPEEAHAFAARLADPDGFDLVVQLAHDLRSPLTSISFLADTLRNEYSGPLTDHQRAQLGLIYSASVGLTSVVADVVDLARAGGDPLEGAAHVFSLQTILDSVRGVVQPLADAKSIELRTQLFAHDRVLGHPLAVTRVLLNLVINGVKFTEYGWVEVTVAPAGQDRVEFSVRDTGRGIAAENLRKLYQPFRRSTHRDGSFFSSSGLGLAIARRLLLSMGSDLLLETRPDWGSRFYFFLDLPAVSDY